MDFTLEKYAVLLKALLNHGYKCVTFQEYCASKDTGAKWLDHRFVILRHDVDLRAHNARRMARLEAQMGVKSTYYFRVVPESNMPDVIVDIARLGHEVGYHYEDLCLTKGDVQLANVHFEKQLAYFRQYYPVQTICMHGSPRSAIDPKDLWKSYDYHDYGLIGEPYFDVDFDQVFYLTDTGRCWNGGRFSVRDKVKSHFKQSYRTTDDIIKAVEMGSFPRCAMMTTHPQRWTNKKVDWMMELLLQSAKNRVKQVMLAARATK